MVKKWGAACGQPKKKQKRLGKDVPAIKPSSGGGCMWNVSFVCAQSIHTAAKLNEVLLTVCSILKLWLMETLLSVVFCSIRHIFKVYSV